MFGMVGSAASGPTLSVVCDILRRRSICEFDRRRTSSLGFVRALDGERFKVLTREGRSEVLNEKIIGIFVSGISEN